MVVEVEVDVEVEETVAAVKAVKGVDVVVVV